MYLKLNSSHENTIRHIFPNARLTIPPKHVLNAVWDLVDKHGIEPKNVSITGGVFWAYTKQPDNKYLDYNSKMVQLKDIDVFIYGPYYSQVCVGSIDGIKINFDYSPERDPYNNFDFYPSMLHMFYRSNDIYFPEELLIGMVVRAHGRRCKCVQARRMLKYSLKGFPIEPEIEYVDQSCDRCCKANWFKLNGTSTGCNDNSNIRWNTYNHEG